MKISIVTDEISADPETAFELGASWGIHDFELRGYFSDRVPDLSEHQKRRLKDGLKRYGCSLIAISPGLFKIPYPATDPPDFPLSWLDQALYNQWKEANQLLRWHLEELLPRSLDFAAEFGVTIMPVFGFDRAGSAHGNPPDEMLEMLYQAAERASAAGVQLAVENEAGFWADTGSRTASLVKTINHPALGVNWDPGNAFFAGDEPYPDGYQEVRGLVKHVHFKDAIRHADHRLEYTTKGQIDWEGQILALLADHYTGFISIETHQRPKVAVAIKALERLQRIFAGLSTEHVEELGLD